MSDTSLTGQRTARLRRVLRVFHNPAFWIVFLGCAPLFALRILPLFHLLAACDFMTYWAAGHLFLLGQNPYSLAALFAVERASGWPYSGALMMFYPPWALPITSVFAAVSYRDARFGWLAVSIVIDCASSIYLWSYFGGHRRRAWVALAIVATFLPMATAEYVGQITPLILASVTSFVYLIRREWYFAAGLVLFGFGLKPHLLFLVWLAVAVWVLQHRRWAIAAGVTVVYATAVIAARVYNPHAFDYFHNTWTPAMGTLTGAGGLLRSVFGSQHMWLQFLPSLVGIAWFVVYWRKRGNQWDWKEHLPLLLLVSLCSAPFFWYHDFILVLPAMIFIAAECVERVPFLIPAWLLIQCAILLCAGISQALEATAGCLWIGFYFYARSLRVAQEVLPLPASETAGAVN